jgi:hypothetical protein
LATVCLPYVASRLGDSESGEGLWQHRGGLENLCRDAIQEFLEPFPVSRFFFARVRDILLLLPRFADVVKPTRLQRHPEYKYGREVFLLLVDCCGWDPAKAEMWPEPPKNSKRPRR